MAQMILWVIVCNCTSTRGLSIKRKTDDVLDQDVLLPWAKLVTLYTKPKAYISRFPTCQIYYKIMKEYEEFPGESLWSRVELIWLIVEAIVSHWEITVEPKLLIPATIWRYVRVMSIAPQVDGEVISQMMSWVISYGGGSICWIWWCLSYDLSWWSPVVHTNDVIANRVEQAFVKLLTLQIILKKN